MMNNTPANMQDIFLQPGELYFGGQQTRIRTLLGSCVAMVFWHPGLLVGGMCHFMLPSAGRRSVPVAINGRYADDAMLLLMQAMLATGAPCSEFQAKLFGGGNMFSKLLHLTDIQVGRHNIVAAHALLQRHGFACVAEHLGGIGHRNVIFDIWSGHVWIRQHSIQHSTQHSTESALQHKVKPVAASRLAPGIPPLELKQQAGPAIAVAPLHHAVAMAGYR